MTASRIRSFGRWHWIAFFAGLAGCWALLFRMAMPAETLALEATFGEGLVQALCGPVAGQSLSGTVAMWAVMSAAMMAPTALPAFATYDDLSAVAPTRFWALVAGFFTVWLGFSLVAGLAQAALQEAGLVSGLGRSLSVPLSAVLLVGAGLYQFSGLKEACLSRCRAPLAVFLTHWEEGPWRIGLRLGLDCVGCCWALMALGFVGGTMSLSFMGLAMALMALEKLPDLGRPLTKPLGASLILAGFALPFL